MKMVDVRDGSITATITLSRRGSYASHNGHDGRRLARQRWANSDILQCRKIATLSLSGPPSVLAHRNYLGAPADHHPLRFAISLVIWGFSLVVQWIVLNRRAGTAAVASQRQQPRHQDHADDQDDDGKRHPNAHEGAERIVARRHHQRVHRRRNRGHEGGGGRERDDHRERIW